MDTHTGERERLKSMESEIDWCCYAGYTQTEYISPLSTMEMLIHKYKYKYKDKFKLILKTVSVTPYTHRLNAFSLLSPNKIILNLCVNTNSKDICVTWCVIHNWYWHIRENIDQYIWIFQYSNIFVTLWYWLKDRYHITWPF